MNRNDKLEDLLKTTVEFKIIEINKQRKRAVGSIKAVLKGAKKEVEEKNVEPFVISSLYGDFAVAHNGALTNYAELRKNILESGESFVHGLFHRVQGNRQRPDQHHSEECGDGKAGYHHRHAPLGQ